LSEMKTIIADIQSYLKNDSLLDIARHTVLYTKLFGFLETLFVKHPTFFTTTNLTSIHAQLVPINRQADGFLKIATKKATESTLVPLSQQIVKVFALSKNAQAVPSTLTVEKKIIRNTTETYLKYMKSLQFGDMDMKVNGILTHHYTKHQMGVPTKEKIMRLASEQLSLSTSLPLALSSSIFLRVDEERMDMMKALIIAPEDTPYAGGCFEFHIAFPDSYPNTPPLVNLETTGSGTVRFNPNLYHCGKVCLSLLGTWHGAEGENWNKATSTLLQVLVSIQSLIFVPQPFYNEPGWEQQMGTPEGIANSQRYNEIIHIGTVEHAMTGQILNPSRGFEDVIRAHFALRHTEIKKQLEKWLIQDKSSAHFARLKDALAKFDASIDKIPKKYFSL